MEALILILIGVLVSQSIKLWREKKYSEMVESSWRYRVRVAQIESELIFLDRQSSARKFVSFLANICSDKESLINLYDLAEAVDYSDYLPIEDFERNIIDLFGKDYSNLVYEAAKKTSMASVLLAEKRHGESISRKKSKKPDPELTYIFKLRDDPEYMSKLTEDKGMIAIA